MVFLDYTYFVYKQLFYKQQAFGWQIAKQLSVLNLFSLSNNKDYRLKEFFICNKHIIVVKPAIQTLQFSCLKSIIGKTLKSQIININFES